MRPDGVELRTIGQRLSHFDGRIRLSLGTFDDQHSVLQPDSYLPFHDPSLFQWKFRLIKSLHDRGLEKEQVRLVFRFLDTIKDLPEELERALVVELAEFEKERTMPFVSPMERIAQKKGEVEAKVEDLLRFLTKRFKTALPVKLESYIRSTNDLAKLDEWVDAGAEVDDLAEFRRVCGI